MNIDTIKVDYSEARRQYLLYLNQSKREGAPAYVRDLRRAYWHMKYGAHVIDVLAAIAKAGTRDGFPAFAIAPANATTVIFERHWQGEHLYSYTSPTVHVARKVLRLTRGTLDIGQNHHRALAPVPIVPAHILEKLDRIDSLDKHHILWDVPKWSPMPPSDPFLLRRISTYLFIVIGQWDCTPLEQAVVRARGFAR